MRIEEVFDGSTAKLASGEIVDVSHQIFCSSEMFGPGHDEECPCLDYDEEGGTGVLTDDEYDARERRWAARTAEAIRYLTASL